MAKGALMIECTNEIDVAQPPDAVFAFIDAEEKAPRWLSRCVELTRTSPGEKTVGATLRYVYKQPGRRGTMNGIVTAYERGKLLGMRYTDRMFEVAIGFDVAPTANGSHVTERISIEPKAFVAKLMTPILRRVTRRQTTKDMAALKRVLETPG